MALTHEQFHAVGNRAEAFVMSVFGMRGTLRRINESVANWLDAARAPSRQAEAERRRRDTLTLARELRGDLDVLIAELETPVLEAAPVRPDTREVA